MKPTSTLTRVPDAGLVTTDWMARLRVALMNSVSERDIQDLAKALLERAKKGDLGAARLLLSYLVGSPSVQIQNAVVMTGTPTDALPGSPEKLEVLAARAERHQPLTLREDQQRKLG